MIANFMALSSEAVAESSAFGRFVEKIDSWIQIGPVEFLGECRDWIAHCAHRKAGDHRHFTHSSTRALDRSKKINELMARFILKLVNVIGWIFLIIAFLGRLGLDMGPVLAGLGITGVVLGFAFQDTIGNLLSGVMIVINAPVQDW